MGQQSYTTGLGGHCPCQVVFTLLLTASDGLAYDHLNVIAVTRLGLELMSQGASFWKTAGTRHPLYFGSREAQK